MKTLYGFTFDKLSNVLGEVASSLTPEERKVEEALRPQLISDLSGFGESMFNLGRSLFDYRAALKVDGTWMTAAKAIADHIGWSERSLFRLIERYEVAAKLPEPMREALKQAGKDPMKQSNRPIVNNLLQMTTSTSNPTPEQASDLVDKALFNDPRENYRALSPDEKRFWKVRKAIRTSLGNYPDKDKVKVLVKALAEEAFIWELGDEITLTIKPRPGIFTIDGRIKLEDVDQECAA